MSKLFIIIGNGFTIDFINHFNDYNEKSVDIDVTNLFHFGQNLICPMDNRPGFLSYKNCPSLWTLGARPNKTGEENAALIEEIITCANMFFDFINEPDQKEKRLNLVNSDDQSLYIKAYSELVVYIKHLFTYYNTLITDDKLVEFLNKDETWGWLRFLKNANFSKFEDITFITYNYDIWLERILNSLHIEYNIYGFGGNTDSKIHIIKPHGSISFVNENDYMDSFAINYKLDFDGVEIDKLKLCYDDLEKYNKSAIIPPAGDSARIQTATWASYLREEAKKSARKIGKSDDVIVCGMSYSPVDRKELDELLINLNQNVNITLINPKPPRDLNAVLISIFKNYVLQTSSDLLGGILNGETI